MVTLAIVFPGQGSQRPGMGLDFAERHPASRAVFEEASDALGIDMLALCRGEDERLGQTELTQPALVTAEIAMLEALRARGDLRAACFGGHSLGEYTALVASGALALADAVRLVRARGRLMQEAVPLGAGAMAAVAGRTELPLDTIRTIARACEVDLANDNSAFQVVLSGLAAPVAAARAECKAAGLRTVALAVSAPFHSRHMQIVAERFRPLLEELAPRLAPERAEQVVSNHTGDFHGAGREALLDALVHQIPGTVRWRDNMSALQGRARRVLEIGPAAPLAGFFRSVGTAALTVTQAADLDTLEPGPVAEAC